MKKRVLSMFMALALCLPLLPTAAFAEGEDVSISGGVIGGGETGGEGGGIYVAPGSPTEGGGGTYIPREDTQTEIWRDTTLWTGISRPYDGTTDGSTIPITLTFTDGANSFELKEGTGFTAVKTFDSADVGDHTVTVEITLTGDAAKQYKLKAGAEKFEIGGTINPAAPDPTVSLSKPVCAVGQKLLPLLSVEGAPKDAAVTYYYTTAAFKNLAGSSDVQGSEFMPKIDDTTAISEIGTYYVYARTAATQNYQEGMSNVLEFTVAEKVDPVASVTSANGTETTYGSFSDAWTAAIANNGSTLKLLADATLPNGNTDLDQSLTLDLNGYVLGSSGSLTVKSGAVLTVRNAGAENSEKPVKVGLYLTLLLEKGGSFTCTDGVLRYLGLLSAGTGDYAIQLAEGENHCTFGGFAQGDESATVGDLLKAALGMALHGDNSGSDVQITRSTLISKGFNYFSFYVGPCSEHQMDANGTCIYCGASYVASVTASGGESTNYTSLDDALDAVKDGDTVTLLSGAEITRWHSLSKAFTLELNGKTATTQLNAELYLHAQVTVQDSSTGKTGGMAGTALLNVQSNGDLTIQSGTFNGRITINDGKLTIKGGTFNQEVDLPRGDSDSVFFSGGTFANIWYPNSSGSFLDLLADGYAFYDKNGDLVNVSQNTSSYLDNVKVQKHAQHTFTNGACACGYTCPHTSVDESGVCEICNKRFAASVTAGEDVTYYDTFGSALSYATRNDGCTLKLLADVTGTTVQINNPFIFDLNGHSVDALSVDARATIKDSGTKKGKIGKVTDLTLGDLLEEGYAFQYENGSWANDSHLQTSAGLSVTVRKAPIQSVAVYAKDKNHKEVSTIAYGTTGEVTLVSSCRMGETSGENLSCAWYKLTDDTAIPPLEGAAGTSYKLPADLSVGEHSYRVTATADGYSKSADITITVEKIDLANATVTIEPWPADGKFRFNPYASETAALNFLSAVKVTANGKEDKLKENDYTYEGATATRVGKYTLTITAKDSCANFKGSKTFDWEVIPYQLYRPGFQSSQTYTKTYDGTTTLPGSYTWLADFFGKEGTDSNVTLKSGDYEVTAAEFVSADAGENKPINQTITLKNENFVFYPTEIIDVKGITTTDKTLTYTNFTPKAAYPTSGTTFNIEKATIPDVDKEVTLDIVNNHADTYTVDLSALLPNLESPKKYGEVTYELGAVSINGGYYNATKGSAEVKDGKLILPIQAVETKETGSIGSVKVNVSTTNYQDFTLTVNVNAANKSGSSSGGGGSSSASKTSTTTNADGSVTKTETKSDGTVVETTTGKDGSTTKTETKKDGSSVTESKDAAGSTGTVKTDKNGQTEAKTALSSKAIEDAKHNGEPVKAPVEVKASRNSNTAPTVKIDLPANSGETKIEIPVDNVNTGTVAVLVHADGTEEIVKNSLPTEDGIQLTVNGGATVKIVDNSKDFIDTRSHWAKDAIDFVSARELVNGMNDSIYAPNNSTTRAQLWTILARQNDADLNGGNTWHEKAQLWSKNKGISDGTEPNAAINRAQMVTMLWRTVGQPTAGGTANFTDVPADSYYASAVAWAVENGITDGVGGGHFDPNSTCTRAQIATFLWRTMAE